MTGLDALFVAVGLVAVGAGLAVVTTRHLVRAGLWLVVAVNTPLVFFGGIGTLGVLGGLLSARFGIRFWEALRHFRWFPF